MKTIRELAPKPSDLVNYMIEGLLENSKREDFQIKMQTFAEVTYDKKICYGCAATCALQKMTGVQLTADNILDRHKIETEVKVLEDIVDELRMGEPHYLFEYYGLDNPRLPFELPFLTNDTWEQDLHHYEHFRDWLRERGM